jgi:hypothetical protein
MRTTGIVESALLFILCAGCNGDRIARLEKENQDLKARLAQKTVSRNDDQMQCLRDTRTFFEKQYKSVKGTTFLNYMSHFNRDENVCYMVIEWHGDNAPLGSTSSMTLWNMQKNSRVGIFFANQSHDGNESVSKCTVNGISCATPDEFYKLVQPFMNN